MSARPLGARPLGASPLGASPLSAGESRQLILELAAGPTYGDDDFLVSPSNEAAFSAIDAWPDWPDPALLVVGPHGSGKSHLAAIWARRSRAAVVSPLELRADTSLSALSGRHVLVEDADDICDESAMFHLVNLVQEGNALREGSSTLLLTARRSPQFWGLKLPDLLSRLRRAPQVEIVTPDDDLVRAVLVKLFVDRQLVVDTSVVEFVARRIDRSLGTARDFVRAIDAEALSQGRRISRILAGDVLRRMELGELQATGN